MTRSLIRLGAACSFVGLTVSRLFVLQFINSLADQFLELGTVRMGRTLQGLVITSAFAWKLSVFAYFSRRCFGGKPSPRRPVMATQASYGYARSIPDIYVFCLPSLF